jgi:hypothetical protein
MCGNHRASRLWGKSAIVLVSALSAAGCDSTTEPVAVMQLEAITATEVTGTVGSAVTPVPVVRVTDDQGSPMKGVPVSFLVGNTGASVAHAAMRTDENGVATPGTWTLGSTVRTYGLTARLAGQGEVHFTAEAGPGPVEEIWALSGANQGGEPGEPLPEALRIQVSDGFGNAVGGVPVAFTVVSGGGSIENGLVVTDADGRAESGAWTLGPDDSVQRVRAESGKAQVDFLAYTSAYTPTSQGQLAFVSGAGDQAEIHVVNADGTGSHALTTNAWEDAEPAWSPDGGRIAFASDRDGSRGIYVMQADGSDLTRWVSGAGAGRPAWSPSGSALAVQIVDEGHLRVGIVSAPGTTVTIVAEDRGQNGHPSWSPDGLRLAFASDRDAYDFVMDVYTMNTNSSDQTRHTGGNIFDLGQNLHPAWSPDGSMIAFVHGTLLNRTYQDIRFHVALMSADGVFMGDVAWAGDIPWRELLDPGSLTWSPDGRGVAYSFVDCDLSRTGTTGCSRERSVRYVPLFGGEPRTIVSNAHSPTWRP